MFYQLFLIMLSRKTLWCSVKKMALMVEQQSPASVMQACVWEPLLWSRSIAVCWVMHHFQPCAFMAIERICTAVLCGAHFCRCLFFPAVVSNNVFFNRVLVEQGRAEEAAEHWWRFRPPRSTKGRGSHPKWGVRSSLPELGEGSPALHELVWKDLTLGERDGRSEL